MNAPVRRMFSTTQALPAVADELPVPRLRRLMWKTLTLPIVVTLLLCGLLVHELLAVSAAAAANERGRAIVAEVARTHRLVVDQEAALRGYLLEPKDMFLTTLQIGQAMTPAALTRLGELVDGDPEQAARALALADVVGRWSAAAGVSASGAMVGEAARLQLGDREVQLEAIRRLTRGLIDAEEARLAAGPGPAPWFWPLAGALGLGLIVAATVRLRGWIRRMEGIYAKAIAVRRHGEASERAARQAAEALAAEVTAQSRELQQRFRALRDELEITRAMRRAV